MRLAGLAAVFGTAVVVAGCGLGLGGLGEAPGDDAGGPDVFAAGDGTVSGQDGPSAEATGGNDAAETGSGGDAAPQEASMVDSPAPPPVEAGCTGVICAGNCTSAATCAGCGGANLLCAGTNTCTSDCTACPGNPIQCFACDSNRLNPIGTCQPDSPTAYCLDTNYAGVYEGAEGHHCACTFATDCPSSEQVCIGVGPPPAVLGCFTCGEMSTDMFTCKANGGKAKCNQMKAACN
jgi:hypothetical protein